MLTSDLLRVKDRKNIISPRYLNLDGKLAGRYRDRAETLIALFQSHIGERRRELTEAIEDAVGDGTDFMVARGLAKLLEDRSEFDTVARADPALIREVVFGLSAQHHPVVGQADAVRTLDRKAVLELACEAVRDALAAEEEPPDPLPDLTVADLEEGLYADHDDNQRLLSFKPLEPEDLLNRYNLALAQAVLYRAHAMRVRLHKTTAVRFRQLFRFMKFYQLMHTAQRLDSTTWELRIDGPMSLFKSTQKYGLQMAMFLPALALSDHWEMEAGLSWGAERKPRTFTLTSEEGLVSHYRDTGTWITEEQQYFEERFKSLDTPWRLSRNARLIELGSKKVLIPDLVFRHEEDGRVAMLEIIGFWRKQWLKDRAQEIAAHGPPNLILAVSDRMRTGPGKKGLDVGADVHLFPFKGVILHKKMLDLVEQVAVKE